jgi:AcrR family transcriptional regulator
MSRDAGIAEAAGSALGTADQRREQMLRAALEVIAERGYADTRIADVAERTGISPALVIYYFKTKDRLLTETIRYSEDAWYADSQRRLAELPTAAARMEEIVARTCLPEADPEPYGSWTLWLDFWALAARNAAVASLREKADERWRDLISSLVSAGLEAGEFGDVDPDSFAVLLSALLDGMAIQVALHDPVVDPQRAFEQCMLFISDQLGFEWKDGQRRRGAAHQAGRPKGAHQKGGSDHGRRPD